MVGLLNNGFLTGWISFEKLKTDRDQDEIFYDWGPRAKAMVDPDVSSCFSQLESWFIHRIWSMPS